MKEISVVDGTAFRLGAAVRDALARRGLPATVAGPQDLRAAELALVLLPAFFGSAGRTLAAPLFVLGRIAACAVPATTQLVLTWCVPAAARARFAAPGRPGGRRWNASDLVLGSAWAAELATHCGDRRAAAACRAARIERAVRADTHRTLGDRDVDTLLADVAQVDPRNVHAMVTQVPDGAVAIWTGLDSLEAAVDLRRDRSRP